jgi:uncharacterized membrane protein YphA (DoxX/SURF4 family)
VRHANRLDLLARAGLCLAFVYSGVSKLFDFPAAIAEQAHFGLQPAAFFAAATIAVQLGGSLLVLFARGRWRALGAAMLAVFTLIATVIGHAFWSMQGMERFHNLNAFLEHAGLIGGFLLVGLHAFSRPSTVPGSA